MVEIDDTKDIPASENVSIYYAVHAMNNTLGWRTLREYASQFVDIHVSAQEHIKPSVVSNQHAELTYPTRVDSHDFRTLVEL
jgi:hypothetical protein